MKKKKILPLIFYGIVLLHFLIFSSSASIAEPPIRVQKCISCCNAKKTTCFNINPDRRLCTVEFENCVTTCRTEGKKDSEWSECWAKSE